MKRAVSACSLFVAACGSLPSIHQVERDFRSEHPEYIVDSWHYQVEGSNQNHRQTEQAVFQIEYHKPLDSLPHTFERRFSTVAEGWIEIPRNGAE